MNLWNYLILFHYFKFNVKNEPMQSILLLFDWFDWNDCLACLDARNWTE